MAAKKYTLGIDLGTTKSVVSIYENGKPVLVETLGGKRILPSVVAFKKETKKKGEIVPAEWLVGESAKNQIVTNPLNTIYGVKRLIGRRFDDPEVKKMQSLASYKIVEGPNGDAWVEVEGKAMSPSEISAKVLRELKAAAEKYLGKDENGNQIEVKDAVITVPAYFNDSQRQATQAAGTIAGLNVLRIINEPTAAALAYGLDKKKEGKVIVYDLGGGTFDVSLLEIADDGNGGSVLSVLSTNGDTFLGGENFDERIMDHLVETLKEETGVDFKELRNMTVLQRLKEAAERAKIELSSQETAEINIPFLTPDVNFEYTLTRGKLESLVQDLIDKTKGPCEKALKDAGLTISDIDEVLLVGAQTRMPKVVETVTKIFGKCPRQDVSVQEIVSMGASVQGAIIGGDVKGIVLVDVIPLSIGIRAVNDTMSPVVPRNHSIPAKLEETFYVSEDGQDNLYIRVYQGERPVASQNKLLGEFTMKLPPGTKKGTEVKIIFNIDADGVLEVTAETAGRSQKITVKANGGLSEAEIERMLKEAEANAEADKLLQARKLAPSRAEDLLSKAAGDEQEDYFTQAAPCLQDEFRAAMKELTTAVSTKNADAMIENTERLNKARTAIGEAFQAATSQKDAAQLTEEAAPEADAAAQKQPPASPINPCGG